MTDSVTKSVVSPTTGNEVEFTVPLSHEEYGYHEDVEDTFNGMQLTYLSPIDTEDSWFELTWTLERVDGDETVVEDDGELEVFCPVCGEETVYTFDGGEFEHLGDLDCEHAAVIRDQPTESGQSHVINYRAVIGEWTE